jgi:hypothetical protein
MKTYFYIITRDGNIFEIENIGDRFAQAINQWQNSGLIVFATLGIALNSVDISKILNEEQYQNFIDSSQPKLFIKNGAWYDIKERSKPIRYEKWRELELEEKRKLQLGSPENKPTKEQIKGWLEKYRPESVKLARKMRIINGTKII